MYAVIGANGYLGSYIVKNILEHTDEPVIATTREMREVQINDRVEWIAADICNEASVEQLMLRLQREQSPVKIVYLAAYHHPDKVQQNPAFAWNVNVTALSGFVNRAAEFTDCIYYASTDSVYGESVDGYHFTEQDPLNPVNIYGHNKCAAEAVMVHRGLHVVRFPFLISPSLVYKPHFYDVIVDTVKKGEKMEMYEDSYRSSLSFDNAAYLLICLMEADQSKVPAILNVCGDRDLSKYDVGKMIASREGLDESRIVPVKMESFRQEGFVTKRAESTLMDNSLLKKVLSLKEIDIFDKPIAEG